MPMSMQPNFTGTLVASSRAGSGHSLLVACPQGGGGGTGGAAASDRQAEFEGGACGGIVGGRSREWVGCREDWWGSVFGGAFAMASLGSSQTEKAEMDSMVSECCAKALRVILGARIPHRQKQGVRRGTGRDGYDHVQKSVDACIRGVCHEPMVVDIFFHEPTEAMEVPSSSSCGNESSNRRRRSDEWSESPQRVPNLRGESWSDGSDGAIFSPAREVSLTLLERWVVSYDQTKQPFAEGDSPVDEDFSSLGQKRGLSPSAAPAHNVLEFPVVYKRVVIMLRSLYCLARTLPAFRLFNPPNSVSHSPRFSLSYMVSHAPPALSEQDRSGMTNCNLTPIETQWGRLCIAAMYKNVIAVSALQVTPQFVPEIIPNYLDSPTTQPLRRIDRVGSFPESRGRSDGRGTCVAPSSGSAPNSPTSVLGRLYSWSGGIRKIFLEKQVAELSQSGIKRFVYRPSEFLQGGFRTSSKVSIHNHEDPEECPFAIDDGKAGDYRSRVGSPGVRSKIPDSPDFQGNTPGSDAGALVRILSRAPPLRQQWTQPVLTDLPVSRAGLTPYHPVAKSTGIVKNSPPKPNSVAIRNSIRGRPGEIRRATSLGDNAGSGLSFGTGKVTFPPSIEFTLIKLRTASDVLKELKEYQDIRDFLVRQSEEFRACTRSL
nr:uncharacterized protein LOC112294368 isoform X2 [Physcomitrium patens]|eukprot:XP_024400476.1 uncharacterized protein LOC112294368 isoform X2 [Physcomitrella patens]